MGDSMNEVKRDFKKPNCLRKFVEILLPCGERISPQHLYNIVENKSQ
jgi:hypothetical protein